jgi:hypothetical protein
MQIQIEIISVGAVQTVPTKNGKSYQVIEVAYKKEGKIEGKKIMSFVSPAVFNAVQKVNQGDVCYVETEKGAPNAAGQSFWQWNSISSASDAQTQGTRSTTGTGTVQAAQGSSTAPTTKTTNSYETKEERAARQVMIVRQSSLSNAIALAAATGDKKVSTTTIINTAKEFEAFVLGTEAPPTTAAKRTTEVHDYFPDDIPL